MPANAVVVLLDSLNRHLLGAYGSDEFAPPNLDRFAAGAVRFERHYTGSLPCIPARHDLLCGALDFLCRPWGSIELWEGPLPADLRRGAGAPPVSPAGAVGNHDPRHGASASLRARRRELPHGLHGVGHSARPRKRS